jgi:hypothetical protein
LAIGDLRLLIADWRTGSITDSRLTVRGVCVALCDRTARRGHSGDGVLMVAMVA